MPVRERFPRRAIDAFDAEALDAVGENDSMDLVSVRLKEAIKATRKRLNKTLAKLAVG